MIFHRDADKEAFIKDMNSSGHKLIVYGYGVLGKTVLPFFLDECGLSDRVLFIADADSHKQGDSIRIGDNTVVVSSPDKISELSCPYSILITGSRYDKILEYLSSLPYLDNTDVYLLPGMLAKKAAGLQNAEKIVFPDKREKIPRIIHYCWFGKNPIPDKLREYMDSWKRFCPDYEIIRWNEDNYDINKWPYVREAYNAGKLGFVPDMIRLDVLYNHGGIYFDTDVELIKPIDELLCLEGFCSTEKWGIANMGGGCGATKGHPMIGEILDYRRDRHFLWPDGSINTESSGTYETLPLISRGFVPDNTLQTVNGLTMLSSDFFQPYDYMTRETLITANTYGIHHFYGSWL
ncbi:glycosyltransferase family 32 protein [Butyrivibrio sp. MC2013]|uniref:glycosyltransferase family 32 protein n=1 Tax=Butyrivibrio sp. MC2013 TaxID=1280686 RepID=UPI000419AE01|nr:glycosyltransferase [Butyrivibrio sp. MC2013]